VSDPMLLLERVTRVAPLGVRFWDPLSNQLIADGLLAAAYPAGQPERRVPARVNHAGVYIFQNLPWLFDAEHGTGDAAYWESQARIRFLVEVTDSLRRFLPCRFAADLPFRGLFGLDCLPDESPPALADAMPLYSAPTRPVPGGMAVVRASLWDALAERPASWALLEVLQGGRLLARGLSDAGGQVALIFPYPEPPNFGSGTPLIRQTWTVQIQAGYSPRWPAPASADICETLAQPLAQLWADAGRKQPLDDAILRFGQELVVRSRATVSGPLLSELWITPTDSLP